MYRHSSKVIFKMTKILNLFLVPLKLFMLQHTTYTHTCGSNFSISYTLHFDFANFICFWDDHWWMYRYLIPVMKNAMHKESSFCGWVKHLQLTQCDSLLPTSADIQLIVNVNRGNHQSIMSLGNWQSYLPFMHSNLMIHFLEIKWWTDSSWPIFYHNLQNLLLFNR